MVRSVLQSDEPGTIICEGLTDNHDKMTLPIEFIISIAIVTGMVRRF